jgi:hypothetical protein
MIIMKTSAIALALGLAAQAATAATFHDVAIQSVSGEWISAGPSDVYGLNFNTSGQGKQVFWGQPPSDGPQSGYEFEGLNPTPVTVQPDMEFDLGRFTHFNNPIYTKPDDGSATAISEAQLRVDFELLIGAEAYAFTQFYTFFHDETPNLGSNGQCAHGGTPGSGVHVHGCADRVDAVLNEGSSESVVVDGKEYRFDISGFQVGEKTMDFFMTTEQADNEAVLVGSYSISEVPLPAAGWMLLAGVGGLVAMKRRKAKAQA